MNGATFPTTGVAALPTTAPNANANAVFDNVALVNSQRISIVSERLAMCAQSNSPNGATYFFNLCISLSRGIDFAIANNEIPAQVSNLPKVCKLVCQRKKDCNLQAAIMVLMVTMKHACNAQWFSTEQTQELLALAEEVARIFNTHEGVSTEQTNINPTVSQIMSRYYPRIKLGHILASVDIKPGFEACAVDFHISKNMSSRTERIQLLVAMKDNIETSSCIITPQKVNFMLNGKGVLGRTVGHTELGPQLPTVVTNMLRYGTNLLQAIGHFDAHYIVLIAFMGDVPSSFLPVPDDYAQPATVAVESDAEVVEGSSRISLNCPITFKRIKIPAKGKLCKHFQCFDLSNYLEMNSRCPSWRCSHCNQSICYPDLRIDKKMSKILQEVAESVVTVIIHSDGSWEGITGNDDHKDEPIAKPTEAFQEESDQPAASGLPNEPCNIYDLTEGDDNMVVMDVDMPEDTKPILQSDLLNTSTYMSHFAPSAAGNPFEINRNSATQAQGISPSGPLETLSGLADYSTRTNTQLAGGASAPMLGHLTPPPPVLTDSVSLAARQTQRAFMGNNQQSSLLPSVPSATNAMQLQQTPRQQMASSVYGGHPLPRNVSREPTANQALPVQMPSPLISTRPAMNNLSGNTSAMNSVSRNTSSLPSRTPVHSNFPINASATHRDSVQQQHSTAQMRGLTSSAQVQNNTFRPTSSPQTVSQPRSSTPAQVSSNTFRPTASPQPTNQPRPTTPGQVHSNAFRPTSSLQIANQPRSTTPLQAPNNTFRPTSSPQPTNQTRPTTPLQVPSNTFRPTSNPQPTNQTRPTNHMLPHTLSTPPHLRARTQTQPGGSTSGTNRTINPLYLPVTPASVPSAQQAATAAVPRSRQLPSTPIQMPTSRAHPASVPSSAPPGRTVQTVSRTQDLVDAQPEQNWQPSGRMRGSLTGRAFSESLGQFVIRPTQQTTPNPPGQSPNQVSNTASTLQALLNRNLHASSQPNPSQNNNS